MQELGWVETILFSFSVQNQNTAKGRKDVCQEGREGERTKSVNYSTNCPCDSPNTLWAMYLVVVELCQDLHVARTWKVAQQNMARKNGAPVLCNNVNRNTFSKEEDMGQNARRKCLESPHVCVGHRELCHQSLPQVTLSFFYQQRYQHRKIWAL